MIDLFRPFVAPEARDATVAVLTPDPEGRVYLGEGSRVQEFEEAFGRLVGFVPPPLALNSCTSALDLALHLIGVGLGDEVISTPMTCTATNGVIVNRGAKLVWADVDPLTGLIDPSDVERKVTPRTKAIMAVDWAGRSCDYRRMGRFAGRHAGVPIIQDAAHRVFVDPDNHGDYVAWSFQAIKFLTAGDGGALLVPGDQHERTRLLRWYGLDRRSSADFRCAQDITEAGFKYHMNDVSAAIGLANLPHVGRLVAQQRRNAEWLKIALGRAPHVVLPPAGDTSDWWLFTVLTPERDSLRAYLAEHGVASSPVHRRNDEHTAFAAFNRGPLPGVDRFAAESLALPVGWWLTQHDLERVAAHVTEWAYGQGAESKERKEAVAV